MAATSFDHVLRTLPEEGEVRFALSDIPLDELLLTLHETRFTGACSVEHDEVRDRLLFRKGQVQKVEPPKAVHLHHLRETLVGRQMMSPEVVDEQIARDPRLDAIDVAECFLYRGLLDDAQVQAVLYLIGRKRLFELYDLEGQVHVRQGWPAEEAIAGIPINPLPAVAYGIAVRASDTRRRAMLAYASHKQVRLTCKYDVERNRWGLPGPLCEAADRLATEGARFGATPQLDGLTPDNTAGLLLLFQRMGLLSFSELTRPPPMRGPSLTAPGAFDERTDRYQREFLGDLARD
jgi:hypothetical protein